MSPFPGTGPFLPQSWPLAHGRTLTLGPNALIMGVINVTPDSFSDGGVHLETDRAVAAGLAMAKAGAHIVDVGGESTRPGGEPVDAATEQARVLPVIERLARESDVVLSIDTYRAETARKAVAAGAHIVNDVWGLQREPAIAEIAAETGAGLVIMHTGRERERDPDVIADQHAFLSVSLALARETGIADEKILLDPGFGFAKNPDENLSIIRRFAELHSLSRPWVVGTSRKRFLGAATGRDAHERDVATAASNAVLRMAGAAVFRVHDVATNRDALAVADAILTSRS